MRTLVLRHVPHEHLGTLALILRSNNLSYDYINFYETDKYPFLEMEERLIKRAIEKDMPILGICLGAQLIAKSLGARVTKNKEKEIGWYPLRITGEGSRDSLFKHLSVEETVFQWHGDKFEIPMGAARLAESPLCPNQAFRFGSSVYGLQFHIEVTPEMISEWLNVPENRMEIISLKGKVNSETIKAETPQFIDRLNLIAKSVFQEFCGLIRK